MSRTKLLAGLPIVTSGRNRGRLDRVAAAKQTGLTRRQLSKAYNNWIQIFRVEGSTLGFADYLEKMREAAITPDDVGCRTGRYNLARIGDDGPYTSEACRFVTQAQNLAEQIANGRFRLNEGPRA